VAVGDIKDDGIATSFQNRLSAAKIVLVDADRRGDGTTLLGDRAYLGGLLFDREEAVDNAQSAEIGELAAVSASVTVSIAALTSGMSSVSDGVRCVVRSMSLRLSTADRCGTSNASPYESPVRISMCNLREARVAHY
jgi:hypothetical protein